MATGKIKTLFSDMTKTEALFPRTKVDAVSNNVGVGLDAILGDMVHASEYIEDIESVPVNADTLGGRAASEYATSIWVENKISEAKVTVTLEDGILKFN